MNKIISEVISNIEILGMADNSPPANVHSVILTNKIKQNIKQNNMIITFLVNESNIVQFASILGENEIKNSIEGTDDDENIVIEVQLNQSNRNVLPELESLCENDED